MRTIARRPAKTPRMQEVEDEQGRKLELLLPDAYSRLGDWGRVADEIGVSRFTMWTWRRFLGLQNYKGVRMERAG